MSTVGWKGKGHLALEFPAGRDLSGQVGVAPVGRMRFRYSDVDKRPEVSVDGAPYVPLATGASEAPAYGGLGVRDNAVGQTVADSFVLVTQWAAAMPSEDVTATLAPSFSLTPAQSGDYRVTVSADVGLPLAAALTYVALAVFVDGIQTTLLQNSSDAGSTSGSDNIALDGIVTLAAGQVVDVRAVTSTGGAGETLIIVDGQFTIEKVSA